MPFIVSTLIGVGFVLTSSLAMASTLDGKTFVGSLLDGKKVIDKNENLVFKGGTFRSSACDKYQFKEASYKATESGGKVAFEAEAANDKGEKMSWKGTVVGTQAEATGVWKKAGQVSGTYTFKGKQMP